MSVCPNCAKFGKPMDAALEQAARPGVTPHVADGLARRQRRLTPGRDVFDGAQMAMELVDDFGERIRTARESRGWSRQDLGARIKQPENAVARYESSSLHPTDEAAKRIEKVLRVKLFEKVTTVITRRSTSRGLTLGDMLKDALAKEDE